MIRAPVGVGQTSDDYITRDLLASGELARLIAADGLRGMTSNPTIFDKAVAGSRLYDADIRRLADKGASAGEIFEALAVADVRAACDAFLPLYERSGGVVDWCDGSHSPGPTAMPR